MSPAVFTRAAVRPFSGAIVQAAAGKPAVVVSPFAPALRRFATARPTTAAAAGRTASKAAPKFSSAAFFAASFRRAAARAQQAGSRRFQSGSSSSTAAAPSWIQRMWDSPVGLKTVHFWAPVMKWVLVLAGVSDFARPAEKLSLTQNLALTATGLIWTRWCLIIKPRNILLAAVNFFLGIVGVIQCTRIGLYWQANKGTPAAAVPEAAAEAK